MLSRGWLCHTYPSIIWQTEIKEYGYEQVAYSHWREWQLVPCSRAYWHSSLKALLPVLVFQLRYQLPLLLIGIKVEPKVCWWAWLVIATNKKLKCKTLYHLVETNMQQHPQQYRTSHWTWREQMHSKKAAQRLVSRQQLQLYPWDLAHKGAFSPGQIAVVQRREGSGLEHGSTPSPHDGRCQSTLNKKQVSQSQSGLNNASLSYLNGCRFISFTGGLMYFCMS